MPSPSLFAAGIVALLGTATPPQALPPVAGSSAQRYVACVEAAALALDRAGEIVADLATAAEQRCWPEREQLSTEAYGRADAATARRLLHQLFAAGRVRLLEAIARSRTAA